MAKQKVSNPLLALLMGAEFMLFEILKILELQDVFKFCATSKTINLEVKKESYDCLWKKLVLLRAGMDPYKTLLRLHRTKRCPNYYSLALKGKWTKPPDSVRYTVEPYELDGLGGFRFQLRPDILIGGNRCIRSKTPFDALPTRPKCVIYRSESPANSGKSSEVDAVPEFTAYLSEIQYFELTVERGERANISPARSDMIPCLSIGLCNRLFPLKNCQPGWRNGSWGYHGDDGNCFHKHGNKTFGQLSTFGNDDEEETVGCGLIRRGRDLVLFFISPKAEHESIKLLNRNGAAPELFPVVGVDSHRVFSVNFGWEKPFKHSYVGLFRKKREIVSMVSIREHRRSEMTQFIIPTVIQLNSPYGNDGYSSSDGFDSSGTSISSADEDMSSFSESTSYPNSSSSMSISDDEEGYDDGVEASWSSRKVSRNTIKSNST